jgi:hypothetical protein
MMDTHDSDTFDLFSVYPEYPGSKGTDTSAEAAEAIAPAAATLRAKALVQIRAAGATGRTAEELAGVMGVDRVSVQPRTSELRNAGKIMDSGQRRENASSGKRAVVWVVPEYLPASERAA